MAGEFVLLNVSICMGGYDLSGLANNGVFDLKQENKEYVCFSPTSPTYKKRLPGALEGDLTLAGYYDVATVETALRATVDVSNTLVMFGQDVALGSPWVLATVVRGTYQRGGQVGEVMRYNVTAMTSGVVVDTAELFEFGAWSATGNGTSRELGAVGADQILYVGLEATAFTGTSPTADVVFESSAIGDYTDAATRATFTQATGLTAQLIAVTGPITDTHFRFRRTIGGSSSPTFTVRGAAGIL